MRTRVCIADPTGVLRAAVRQVLARDGDFDVVEASDLAELEAALDTGLDIALIDEHLPVRGALAAVKTCAGRCKHVVVWSMRPERERVLAAIRAGATGY
jgi:DNA-binding NarL/FixJ family response regulator